LIQNLRWHAVDVGEVSVEDHAFAADRMDHAVDRDGGVGQGESLHDEWRPATTTMRK
jgi:hypothetical protein